MPHASLSTHRLCTGAFAAFGLLAAGCPAPPPKAPAACAPQTISVRLLGSTRLNQSAEGEPRPLVARVYHLKSDRRLDRVAFDQLWHNDKALLADDLVKVDEVQMFPGARTDVQFPRDAATQTVVAVGLFESPHGRTWLYTADLPQPPAAGRCTPSDCAPDDDECRIRANTNLVLPIFFDVSTVDDGSDQAAEYTEVGPKHVKAAEAPKGPAR